jgi:hypothetical protein
MFCLYKLPSTFYLISSYFFSARYFVIISRLSSSFLLFFLRVDYSLPVVAFCCFFYFHFYLFCTLCFVSFLVVCFPLLLFFFLNNILAGLLRHFPDFRPSYRVSQFHCVPILFETFLNTPRLLSIYF